MARPRRLLGFRKTPYGQITHRMYVTLLDRDGVPGGLYLWWVRRSPRPTVSDQNRSCRTTLSTPNTKITSPPPDLTHKKIVSSCPSLRLSTLSVNTAKQASAPI